MLKPATMLSLAAATTFGHVACDGSSHNNMPPPVAGTFKDIALVSNGSVAAPNVDPNLENGWV
jgi:hypothetical protein